MLSLILKLFSEIGLNVHKMPIKTEINFLLCKVSHREVKKTILNSIKELVIVNNRVSISNQVNQIIIVSWLKRIESIKMAIFFEFSTTL